MKKQRPQQLHTKDGRLVGTLYGNKFKKYVKNSRHRFKAIGKEGSWGMDYDVLYSLKPEVVIEIFDQEMSTLYMQSAGNFRTHGVIKHFKEGQLDHYVQVFLPLESWDKVVLGIDPTIHSPPLTQ